MMRRCILRLLDLYCAIYENQIKSVFSIRVLIFKYLFIKIESIRMLEIDRSV